MQEGHKIVERSKPRFFENDISADEHLNKIRSCKRDTELINVLNHVLLKIISADKLLNKIRSCKRDAELISAENDNTVSTPIDVTHARSCRQRNKRQCSVVVANRCISRTLMQPALEKTDNVDANRCKSRTLLPPARKKITQCCRQLM